MKIHLTIIAIFVYLFSFGQAYPVFLDGSFDEWPNSTNTFADEAGDGNSIDLLNLKILNDQSYLYIYLKMYEVINLNTDNTLVLLLDTDNDAATGFQKNGIGAELKWNFSRRKGTFYYSGTETSVWHSDIGFVGLPTVSGPEFEMAINRNTTINGYPLFQANQIKTVVYADETSGDMIPEPGSTFSYTFDESATQAFEEINLSKTDEGFLRLMTYNTLYDGIADAGKQESFKRIIQAVNPDVLTLNECWDTEASYIKTLLNQWLPINGGQWYASKIADGNITASRYPITNNYNVLSGQRLAASYIDLPNSFASDLVVVNCHLKCCNEASDNVTRQYETDGLISFIMKMKNQIPNFEVATNTPFVFMGDFNLVGGRQQLHTLINGDIQNTSVFGIGGFPDWNNQPMGNVVSTGTNNRMAYTWRDDSGSYWPGRLDYIFYTQSSLKKEKSFILETAKISTEFLNAYNLQASDAQTASDHFTHVADFSVHEYNTIHRSIANQLTVYPNPAQDYLRIDLPENEKIHNLQIFDASGKCLFTLIPTEALNHRTINTNQWKAGVYLIRVMSNKNNYIQKVLIE
ncbi:MAG TPA: hypothetical protein DCY97_12550 [Marinilabiliales bacterium]|jgi:endonuclease/exonuclease/phosphatase family metal-dependent hydrolase|nr:hypothetical protein [Marinilabiliales bacterium]